MTLPLVPQTDTYDQWRQKTNAAIALLNLHTEQIGSLPNLETADKSSLVNAINEVQTHVARVEAIAAGGGNIHALILTLGG